MAEEKKKTQAEKAAASGRAKKVKNTTVSAVSKDKKPTNQKPETAKQPIPVRLISSLVCLGLFILFLVIFFKPDGALVALIDGFIHGLVGNAAFIVSIPVLLYLFYIHAFSGERPIKMRTICLIAFVLIIGCFSHLALNPQKPDFNQVRELYAGGITEKTGGFICGLFALFLDWLLGKPLSYILLGVSAAITLLGGMQITIPSIVRAIQNRPRSDLEDMEMEERQEPVSVVVNHFANKRIEHLERKRLEKEQEDEAKDEQLTIEEKEQKKESKGAAIFRQIKSDVEDPVAASVATVDVVTEDPEIITFTPVKRLEDTIPEQMPELEVEEETPSEEAVVKTKKPKVTAKDAEDSAAKVAMEIEKSQVEEKPTYLFPPVNLLKAASAGSGDGTAEMRENSRRLNETLASFKIEAHIINVTRGPSVTRYEVELEKGVRLNKLTTAADDIALSLGATGVRIAAVPGKISVVGIEVPNRAVTTVSLREVIDSLEFANAKSKSSFAVGKDIGGNCIVGNIAKLPHMLIAGTTGSGKSVCMNSLIISLLYKASPEDVKLIMIDPKMVELGIYNGIPHLLIPVVTDPKKAAGSLQWAVTEMMRRYKAMSDAGVRDLEAYNTIMECEEGGQKLPQVVVIIDELADLMLVAAKEVEESICRIAQMGRAAGIHLVIATQRPSADVITGLMKANIPSRIAFAVASAMESRIILDTQGAEKLVGKGDMLYAPIGNGKPRRVQGCFVSDTEVEAVASYVKENFTSNYDEKIMEDIEKKALQTGNKQPEPSAEATPDELDGDEMLPAAVDVILETGQASVSMLQRRLKLGYARAARIVDEMEEKGIVGPFVGSKPRAILVTKEQWQAMRSGNSAQMGFEDLEEDEDSEEF